MKSRLVLPAVGAVLLVAAGVATAQETQQYAQPSPQATTQENTSASPQSGTDTSYGGVRDTRSASGVARTRPCAPEPQCNIFFGQ
jgi:hypothetical protein